MAKTRGRYAPARRLDEVRTMLNSAAGASVYDIADQLGTSVRTAIRYLRAVEAGGDELVEEIDGKRKVWRLATGRRHEAIRLSTSQMIALFLSRRVFDFLAGTGFKEDLDDVFARLEATLKRRDFLAARHLDRKLYDINEAPHLYGGRIEDVNDITTALLREERLRIRHESVADGRKAFVVEPLSLLVYKKGLYLVGRSEHHASIRTFAVDGLKAVDWLRGDKFEYPDDYHPSRLVAGAFGLIGGQPTQVRIFFDAAVARYVRRRQWHPSQRIRSVDGGIELRMKVAPSVEVASWVLGFGDRAIVCEPAELRDRVRDELQRAAANYSSR